MSNHFPRFNVKDDCIYAGSSYQVHPIDERAVEVNEETGEATLKQFMQGSNVSAGLDLLAYPKDQDGSPCDMYRIEPGGRKIISTGVRLYIALRGVVGMIYPRSSLGVKHGVILSNSTGVIDADYQGELGVPLWNTSDQPFDVHVGDRIAQIVFHNYLSPCFSIKPEGFEANTVRGMGGFGSTGRR